MKAAIWATLVTSVAPKSVTKRAGCWARPPQRLQHLALVVFTRRPTTRRPNG